MLANYWRLCTTLKMHLLHFMRCASSPGDACDVTLKRICSEGCLRLLLH